MSLRHKVLIISLVLISILLIAAYFFVENHKIEKYKNEVSAYNLNNLFVKVLKDYNVKESWIEEKGNLPSDSLIYNYEVKLPKDLPVPFILKEFNNLIDHPSVNLDVVEHGFYGNSVLKVISQGKTKLRCEFLYEKELKRENDSASFILFNADDLNDDELTTLLTKPESFTLLLEPSKDKIKLVKQIVNNKKEFAVLLNDNIDDIEYRFSNEFSKKRIESSLKEILTDYQRANMFVVDEKSDLYQTGIYSFIEEELTKRNIKILKYRQILEINEDYADENKIKNLMEHSNKNKTLLGLDADNYLNLNNAINKLRKAGIKFIPVSNLIREMNP